MREIKFRAWDKVQKKMITENLSCGLELNSNFNNPTSSWIYMQFTGLLDKNGKEIYEGDIVEYFDTVFSPRDLFVVDFINGMFYLKSTEDDEYNAQINEVAPLNIIGNIYENPELLTGGTK